MAVEVVYIDGQLSDATIAAGTSPVFPEFASQVCLALSCWCRWDHLHFLPCLHSGAHPAGDSSATHSLLGMAGTDSQLRHGYCLISGCSLPMWSTAVRNVLCQCNPCGQLHSKNLKTLNLNNVFDARSSPSAHLEANPPQEERRSAALAIAMHPVCAGSWIELGRDVPVIQLDTYPSSALPWLLARLGH